MKKRLISVISFSFIFIIEPALAEVSYFHPGKHEVKPRPVSGSTEHALGMPVTKTFDLVFKQSTSLDFRITPETDLNSGKIKDAAIVANYQVDVFPPTRLGLRWTPGKGDTTKWYTKIRGRNDSKHILSLTLTTETYKPTTFQDGWIITDKEIQSLIGTIYTNGDQSVPADTYTISMDASAFIS